MDNLNRLKSNSYAPKHLMDSVLLQILLPLWQ